MTVIEALKKGEEILNNAKVEDCTFDCKLFMLRALNVSSAKLICMYNDNIDKKSFKKYMKDIKKRAKHMPSAYIVGTRDFYGRTFNVNKNVLIPRADTEILVEKSLETFNKYFSNEVNENIKNSIEKNIENNIENKLENNIRNSNEKKYNDEKNNSIINDNNKKIIIDMCTGSGCIAISLAKELSNANVYGIDISKKALKVAKSNVLLNDAKNVTMLHSNLFNTLKSKKNKDRFLGKVSMIVSNPPYIKTEICKALDDDVRLYEPNLALCGGDDGLIFYKKIAKEAREFLINGGILAYEIDYTYFDDIKKMLEDEGYEKVMLYKDYGGRDRVVIARLNKRIHKL